MIKLTGQNNSQAIVLKLKSLTEKYHAIDLSRNYTDFAPPAALIDGLNQHIAAFSKYAPPEGSSELRQAIAQRMSKRFFRTFNPQTQITITNGATQAIFCAIASTVGEGDEVIVFEPLFKTYIDAIRLAGARPTFLQLRNNLTIDWQEVQKAITAQTKLIIVNTPHYPTGAMFGPDDWEALQKLIIGTKIKVLSDEALSQITFAHSTPSSIAFYPKLASNCFIINSLSKSLCVAGWKIGYCVAADELTQNFRTVQNVISNSVNCPMQLAFADYLQHLQGDHLFPYAEMLETNRNLLLNQLSGTKLKLQPIDGGYFQAVDCAQCTDYQDVELAQWLITQHGVATMPMSLFYHDKHERVQLRLNIAVDTKLLKSALTRLKSALT